MREKRSYAQEVCVKSAGKAMQRTGMIRPGCRIGVAVSGGVDSFVLLKTLHIRQGIVPFRFEIMAIHLNPGFDPQSHMPLAAWLSRHGIPSHLEVTDFGPHAHSAGNQRRSPCFRCAWLRRKRLFELCARYRLTHLALGHNAEDLVSTFFMNLCRNGRVDGMSMNEPFFGGKLHLIRPLGFDISERAVRRAGLDYWHLVEVFDYENLDDFFEKCPEAAQDCWLTTTKAPRSYQEARFSPNSWIFFGKETAGLPMDLRERFRDRCIRLPMIDEARSLNLSNTVAVCVYEALRQNDFPGLLGVGEMAKTP